MARRVPESQVGNTLVGRILSFERVGGYGFIRTSTGEDILLSSYDVPKRVWKKLCVGDYVEFVASEQRSNSHPIVASNTVITKKMPRHLSVVMPNQKELEIRHICRYGRSSLIKDGYDKLYPGYPGESFDYVFIKTSKKSFVFNRHGSPVVLDGEADVDEFYLFLTDLLAEYDINRDYEAAGMKFAMEEEEEEEEEEE